MNSRLVLVLSGLPFVLRRDRATVALPVGDIGRTLPVCTGEIEAKRAGERLRKPCDM